MLRNTVYTPYIRKNFELDMSDDAIAMSSGFPWGLGGGGCICGALAGGTMCIGYFFGPLSYTLSFSNSRKMISAVFSTVDSTKQVHCAFLSGESFSIPLVSTRQHVPPQVSLK